MENLNRLKAVLADSGKTNKWLAEQLGKDPVAISKWCTNTTQPDLQTLAKIGADNSSTLTVNFKGYVNGKFTHSYSKTFTAGQYSVVFFNSLKHSTDGENIVEKNKEK